METQMVLRCELGESIEFFMHRRQVPFLQGDDIFPVLALAHGEGGPARKEAIQTQNRWARAESAA
jgi:hypothetical protein